jgi:hypothetical protein
MAPPKSPRKGSLQFWPRKRVSKFLPSVNWKELVLERILKDLSDIKLVWLLLKLKI